MAELKDVAIEDGPDSWCPRGTKTRYAQNTLTKKDVRATVRATASFPTNGYPNDQSYDIPAGMSQRVGCDRLADSPTKIEYKVIAVVEK